MSKLKQLATENGFFYCRNFIGPVTVVKNFLSDSGWIIYEESDSYDIYEFDYSNEIYQGSFKKQKMQLNMLRVYHDSNV